MQRWHLLSLLAVLAILQVHALAQVSGTINAEPNPCTVERGRTACTSHITWTTQGVARAKVIVMDEHRRGEREQEFGTSLECTGHKCRAPWIEKGNQYIFTLYDYSSGHRGAALSSVTVRAQ